MKMNVLRILILLVLVAGAFSKKGLTPKGGPVPAKMNTDTNTYWTTSTLFPASFVTQGTAVVPTCYKIVSGVEWVRLAWPHRYVYDQYVDCGVGFEKCRNVHSLPPCP